MNRIRELIFAICALQFDLLLDAVTSSGNPATGLSAFLRPLGVKV
jgi:hypothetical protein